MMKRLGTVFAALAVAAPLALTACSSGPDVAACKAAMRQQFAQGMADPSGPPATRPAACKEVPDKTIEQIVYQIMSGQ